MRRGSKVWWPIVAACVLAMNPSWAGPIEDLQPGEWYEVPNSRLDALDPCPTRNCVYSGGQSSVVTAWNGGTFDTKRNRLVLWGGGHSDYGGNEMYVFDVNTLQWTRLTNPSTNIANNADPYPDGRPNPRHTYGSPVYIPSIDRYWVLGGSIWYDGGCFNKPWMYNFSASPPESGWEVQVSTIAGEPTGDCGGLAVYDPLKDRVILLAGLGYSGKKVIEFNPRNLSAPWKIINDSACRNLSAMGALDTKRRKFVVIGGTESTDCSSLGTWVVDIDKSGAPMSALSTTGTTEIESTNAPGVVYDPISDRIVAWNGGATVYTLNMDTRVWEKHQPAASNKVTPGSTAAARGVFGRFQYIPSANAFIVVTSTSENVFIYKLSSSTGIAPPQQPAKPTLKLR